MPEKQEKKSILEQQETDPDQDYPGSDFELDIIHLYLAEDFSDLEGEVDSPPEEINSAFPEVNALGYPDQSNQFETPALPEQNPFGEFDLPDYEEEEYTDNNQPDSKEPNVEDKQPVSVETSIEVNHPIIQQRMSTITILLTNFRTPQALSQF